MTRLDRSAALAERWWAAAERRSAWWERIPRLAAFLRGDRDYVLVRRRDRDRVIEWMAALPGWDEKPLVVREVE